MASDAFVVRGTRSRASCGMRRLVLCDAQIREHHPDLTEAALTVAWSYCRAHAERSTEQ